MWKLEVEIVLLHPDGRGFAGRSSEIHYSISLCEDVVMGFFTCDLTSVHVRVVS